MNACVNSRSHLATGKLGLTEARPAVKCNLKVCIARSVALTQWVWGGTSWKDVWYLTIEDINSCVTSLSSIHMFGGMPVLVSVECNCFQAWVIVAACLFLIGNPIIALLL